MNRPPSTSKEEIARDFEELHDAALRDAGTSDISSFESRLKYYDLPISYDQYVAMRAFTEAVALVDISSMSDEDKNELFGNTFGKTFRPGHDLRLRLQQHYEAMGRAYDEELAEALQGFSL